ncbi:MAG: hypothetical protein CVU40_11635 [Chloroflexi bacterium HGW-Chloroflexi-2]|jgi:uncharacterized membrane protein|nr:MAG: hypothetical protein CVU40_11635 [Chloroflexi bacterium HGW-Chloroflexi-2]
MNFKFDFGYAITAFTALLFYLRIAMLRGKKRRLARTEMAEVMQMAKGKRQKDRMAAIEAKKGRPAVEVKSWFLVIIAIVLMLVGIVAKNYPDLNLPQALSDYWWAGPSIGFIIFIFAFK